MKILDNEKLYSEYKSNPKLKKIVNIFSVLSELDKCIWCSNKYPNGILRKQPNQEIAFDSLDWFRPDFLAHVQTTHGFSPDIIQMFMEVMVGDIEFPPKR